MTDQAVVHIGENSPEQVAYKLLRDIARLEKKYNSSLHHFENTDRKWILETYADCLDAARGLRSEFD